MGSFVGDIYFRLNPNQRLERIWKIAHIDFKKRYYDNFFGLIWALFNPLFRISIYYFVFSIFFTRSIDNFALYLFSGLISWMFFVECSNKCMHSLTQKKYLIDSLQFNKIDLFYSASISTLLGYLFNVSAYLIIALILGINFSVSLLYFPLLILNLFLISMATGMILATIKIYFKDISYFWDLFTLLGFWTCPIFFRGEDILEKVPLLMYLNPVSGIIMNSRAMLLNAENPFWNWMVYDMGFATILFLIAKLIFDKFSHRALEYM